MKYNEWKILLVSEIKLDNFEKQRLQELIKTMQYDGMKVIQVPVMNNLVNVCTTQRELTGVIIDWNISCPPKTKEQIILQLHKKFNTLPIFVLSERVDAEGLPDKLLNNITGYYWLDDDTLPFMAGRIKHIVNEYINSLYPPFFKELKKYVETYKYAWHTPGHMGGEGFLKSPVGCAFYQFFGENVMRSDLSISVPELGSLLDHSGVVNESEKLAGKTFGADQSYYILNGTSTANQVIWRSQVANGDLALVDRNCHKSLNYAMVITGAIPMYMKPRRNAWGIIGPVRLSEFSKEMGLKKIQESPLTGKENKITGYKMSALTNSTYDGICYNVSKIKQSLESHVENLHFDEAWYAYAKFHPLYKHFFGMTDEVVNGDHPPVFCSQSTHKLLTAFSQASMIHIKQGGTRKIIHDEFNEAYMMHGSTSPNYQMIASLDVATEMMAQNGKQMSDDNILAAIELRQKIARIHQELGKSHEWFFQMWQPQKVKQGDDAIAFIDVNPEFLRDHQSVWILSDKDDWHGFEDIETDFLLLDPIKLTFLTPGIDKNGNYSDEGIPAGIVTDYLIRKGIVVEKTDTYSFLMLHSFGTTKGKQGELLAELFNFKRDYDRNASIAEIFPALLKEDSRYSTMGIKDLCQEMHRFFKENDFLRIMHAAFEKLPEQVMKPADAFQNLVRKNVEYVRLDDMMNRIPAVMIVPYPPGIPVIMGGELLNAGSGDIFKFLEILQKFENTFKGYEKDIHGVERDRTNGRIFYKTLCIKQTKK